jgi:tRNA1(Val) A37 N6-methylase TrmN6
MTSRVKKYNQYFTPPGLAAKLIQAITIAEPNHIGDFAAGDGELLRAAENRWPNISCTAIDIDDEVISKLRISHPNWIAKCFDFTDIEARSKQLRNKNKITKFPVITLNPPFAIHDGEVRLRPVSIAGIAIRCSAALAFIIEALSYLRKGGQLVAIVPHSVVQSERDEIARQLLIQHFNFEIVESFSNISFKGCSPRTAIIRLTNKASKNIKSVLHTIPEFINKITKVHIFRGSLSNTKVIHSDDKSSIPFIHTTDLSKGLLHKPSKFIHKENTINITGPAVLMPRVGKPDIQKIVLLPKNAVAVISDCVIALLCDSEEHSEVTHSIIVQNWLLLEQIYGGTCARYISIKELAVFLHNLGFETTLYSLGLFNQNSATAKFIQGLQLNKSQIGQETTVDL